MILRMTVRFNFLGYTIASIDVDLTGLTGVPAAFIPLAGQQTPVVNAFVKRVSTGWLRRMMAP